MAAKKDRVLWADDEIDFVKAPHPFPAGQGTSEVIPVIQRAGRHRML